MDAYLREKGACSVQMMRATAATQVSIDYQDETDFVRKMWDHGHSNHDCKENEAYIANANEKMIYFAPQ